MLMKEKLFIYLYFKQKENLIYPLTEQIDENLLCQTHFYSFLMYLAKERGIEHNELFFVEKSGAIHLNYDTLMSTLYFYGYVDEDDNLTEEGLNYYHSIRGQFIELLNLLDEFIENYSGKNFIDYHENYVNKKSLLEEEIFFPVTFLYQKHELYRL